MPRAAAVCAFIVMFVHVWGQCFKLLGLGPAAGAEDFLPTNKVHVDSMSRVHVFQEDERLQERARGGTDVRPLMSLGSSREDRG